MGMRIFYIFFRIFTKGVGMPPWNMCIILRNLFCSEGNGTGTDCMVREVTVSIFLLHSRPIAGALCEEGELSHIRKTAIHSWGDNLLKSLYFPV